MVIKYRYDDDDDNDDDPCRNRMRLDWLPYQVHIQSIHLSGMAVRTSQSRAVQ